MFTGDIEAFLRSRPPLSSDLIQPYKPPNPWPSSLTFEGDFILVCEFSEIEGPIPLVSEHNVVVYSNFKLCS